MITVFVGGLIQQYTK